MNSLKTLKEAVVITLLLLFSHSLFSQKIAPKVRSTAPDHIIVSKIMGKEYQLYISFPKSYSTKDSIAYPVLYVLDGHLTYPIIRSIQKLMDVVEGLQEVIIVGIGSEQDPVSWMVNRSYDYTASIDSFEETKIEKEWRLSKGSIKTGGAAKFLESIKTEIIPVIEKKYKTTNDRGIAGHSLGGLFTAYCLLNSDGYFTRFGMASPALYWNNNELLNQAVLQFSKNNTWDIPATKVFVSVGGKETPAFVQTMTQFVKALNKRAYKNITLQSQRFENETHLSVLPASMTRILTVLYGK